MAEVQTSGPLVGQPLTDETWRGILGDEPSIVGDYNGSAFSLTLPPASDSVELGSASLDSLARVGGFLHRIPAGTTQSLEIPPSSNASVGRTDLIVSRLDPSAYTAAPGPVRLYRIAGVEGSAARPAYDQGPPGQEDLPHWAITRKSGQALTQADVVDLRMRSGSHLLAAASVTPFPSMPLGSTITRGERGWERVIGDNGSPAWVERFNAPTILDGAAATESSMSYWDRQSGCRLIRDGNWRALQLVMRRTSGGAVTANSRGGLGDLAVVRLHEQDRPSEPGLPMAAYLKDVDSATYMAGVHISSSGLVVLNSTLPNVEIGPAGPDDTLRAHCTWYVP